MEVLFRDHEFYVADSIADGKFGVANCVVVWNHEARSVQLQSQVVDRVVFARQSKARVDQPTAAGGSVNDGRPRSGLRGCERCVDVGPDAGVLHLPERFHAPLLFFFSRIRV